MNCNCNAIRCWHWSLTLQSNAFIAEQLFFVCVYICTLFLNVDSSCVLVVLALLNYIDADILLCNLSNRNTYYELITRRLCTAPSFCLRSLEPDVVEQSAHEPRDGEPLRQDPTPHHDLRHVGTLLREVAQAHEQAQRRQTATCSSTANSHLDYATQPCDVGRITI